MSTPLQKIDLQLMASSLGQPDQTNPRQADDAVFTSLGSTPELVEEQVPPTGDLGEVPGYSYLLVEYFKELRSKDQNFAENLAGVFLDDYQVDGSSRYFNQYPPPVNTWEMDYITNTAVIDPPVALVPAGPQPYSPPPSTSTTSSRSQKIYNCTYCGTLFDRYSRARDCRNMDLGLMPHRCLARCGTVACPVAYGSEALLFEHIRPRSVQCPWCPRTLSKKNMARHQKRFCPGRSLPADPSTTGADE